ncbi:MAG: multifunctional CCA addition/repair protein [Pseudomonadales bacterium]|nr:multifunctional CCA addition/repair protein [Pseudomonadales bacterium]
MRIYLVGGAVRDRLLGLPVQERDWVVVGSSSDEMMARGFRQVGHDFPVFLHPQTGEEYALARTEQKQGRGYKGFSVAFSPEVTLQEDLFRRDLSINAMAEDEHGELIDPYGGLEDLRARRLRHVSPAFVEDPLRVLRVARFASRFADLGFTVTEATYAMMQTIAASGELNDLTAERVWKETARSLMGAHPSVYFRVLRHVGAMHPWFTEIDRLFGVPQNPQWHPEVDTGEHTMMALDQSAHGQASLAIRVATLLHDLGKADTPHDQWPHHPDHGMRGLPQIKALSQRLKLPREVQDLALLVATHHIQLHKIERANAAEILNLLKALDALRRPKRMLDFIQACHFDIQGRLGHSCDTYPQGDCLRTALEVAERTDLSQVLNRQLKGPELALQLDQARILELSAWLAQVN